METDERKWRDWNWRSEGDILVNGAFFIASGESVEVLYEKAYSVEPKSAALIDQLTMNAGVLGGRSLLFLLSFSFTISKRTWVEPSPNLHWTQCKPSPAGI